MSPATAAAAESVSAASHDDLPAWAELRTCIAQIEDCRTHVRELVDGLDDARFNWSSAPKKWSIAQCIAHVTMAAEKFGPNIEMAVQDGRAKNVTGEPPFKLGFMGGMMASMSSAYPPKLKMKAPPFANPPKKETYAIDELVPRFLAWQDRLEQVAREAQGLDLARVKGKTGMPMMKFSLIEWLTIMPGHQLRHLKQARDVRSHPDFPAA
ncbi:MAG: DinB family protein [Acidobacteriota bacterium]